MSEYIKKDDAIKAFEKSLLGKYILWDTQDKIKKDMQGRISQLPTYSIPETAKPCEYIKKADALRIASITTLSVDQVVSTIKALSTYSFPDSAESKEDKKIGDLTLRELKEMGVTVYTSPSLTNI